MYFPGGLFMKVCQKCGTKNVIANNFCESCAFPLNATATTPTPSQIPQYFEGPVQQELIIKPGKKRRIGCLVFIILIPLVAMIVGLVANNNSKNQDPNASPTPTTSASAAETKANIGEQDKIVWEFFNKVKDAHNNLMEAMESYAEGNATKLDFYNYCKDVEAFQASINVATFKDTPDIAPEYIRSIKDMALKSQLTAKKLMQYLDSGKTSDLSEAQVEIKLVNASINIIAQNRVKVLSDAGYTVDEIKVLAEAE